MLNYRFLLRYKNLLPTVSPTTGTEMKWRKTSSSNAIGQDVKTNFLQSVERTEVDNSCVDVRCSSCVAETSQDGPVT